MKNLNLEELEKIELKSDGKNAGRFRDALQKIVQVSKEELDKHGAKKKKKTVKRKA